MIPLVSFVSITLGLASPVVDELAARVRVRGDACPGVELADRVRAQLGGAIEGIEVDVDGSLRRRADGQWELELAIARGDDEPSLRSFVAPHCETALEAGALVVALAMDPSRGDRVPQGPVVPDAEPSGASPAESESTEASTEGTSAAAATDGGRTRTTKPTGSQPPRASTTTPVPSPRVRKVRALVRAGGGVDGGGLPRAAALFEVALGARGRGWRAEATAIYRLESEDRAQRDADAGGRFSLWAVGARACGVPARRTLEFPLCAALEGGQLLVRGFGFVGRRDTRRAWGAVTFGPALAWVVRPNIALVLQAALGVPLVRSEIEIVNLERIHRTGPVFGRGWLGFEGRFP